MFLVRLGYVWAFCFHYLFFTVIVVGGGCDLAQLQERLFLSRLLLGHVDQVALVGREFETAEGGVGVDAAVDVELGQVPAVLQPAFPPDL